MSTMGDSPPAFTIMRLNADVAGLHRGDVAPWELLDGLDEKLGRAIAALGAAYAVSGGVAVHVTARVDPTATIKAPVIIGPECFVGPHTLLRGGVWLMEGASVGPGVEIARSVVGERTALAHFNFVGDSVLGAEVNMEAGAVIANHYNERTDKTVHALVDGTKVSTGTTKFGALVGDGCKIGANAVLSPGTMLTPQSVVGRLELVDQVG